MSASSSSATPPSSASKKQAEVAPSQIVVSYWTAVGSVTHILTFSSVHNIPPPCRVTIDDLSGALHSLLSKDVFIAYRDAGISSELAKHVEAFDKPSVQALSVRIFMDNSVAFVQFVFRFLFLLANTKTINTPLPPPPFRPRGRQSRISISTSRLGESSLATRHTTLPRPSSKRSGPVYSSSLSLAHSRLPTTPSTTVHHLRGLGTCRGQHQVAHRADHRVPRRQPFLREVRVLRRLLVLLRETSRIAGPVI